MGYWRVVARRALRESLSDVRWDNAIRIVIALFPVLVTAGATWIILNDAAGASVRALATIGATALIVVVLFVIKVLSLPPRMAAEATIASANSLSALNEALRAREGECSTLKEEIKQLRAPPPPPSRDPDGIYQMGRRVGSARGALKNLADGVVTFALLDGDGDFNKREVFEYHDLELSLKQWTGEATRGGSGVIDNQRFTNATCLILRRK